MTKKELIAYLVDNHDYDEKDLNKLKVAEVEEIYLEKVKSVELDAETLSEDEHTDESLDIEELESSTLKENREVESIEVQPRIYEVVYRKFPRPKYVQILNLGQGDVYVGGSKEEALKQEVRLRPKEELKMGNVTELYFVSSSRPIVKINYSSEII